MFDTRLLRELIRTGKAGELVARGIPGGFVLVHREGLDEQMLEAQRGGPRKFKRLDAVAKYLRQLGASAFRVEIGQWSTNSLNV